MANMMRNLARKATPPRPFLRSVSTFKPSVEEVNALIVRAEEHPLGLSYLRNGYLDSVAATFEVHAFVVNDAREKLATRS